MSNMGVPGLITIAPPSPQPLPPEEYDFFDYQATVNELTIQFLSEHEDTRVAALKWLIMLHQKAPKNVSKVQLYLCCFIEPNLFLRYLQWMTAHFRRC